MARTVGPLMSLEASGSVAKTIVFSKWKGRPYVRQLVTPSNPKSALQVSTRAVMKFLSQRWATDVTAGDKATWLALANAAAVSEFNEYVRANLKRWTQFTGPSQANPATGGGTDSTYTALPAVTGGVRQMSIAWTINALNDGWGLLIFQKLGGAVTSGRDTLKLLAHLPAGASSAVITPLAPGHYYYQFRTLSAHGKISADLGAADAIVT